MSAPPRPQFFEGQLLAAGDLGAQVDYARFGDAVHARSQHTWGVVTGLTLKPVSQTAQNGSSYVDVYLEPGIAIDVSGRRIVVDSEQLLSTVTFIGLGIANATDPTIEYPVYLLGTDQPQQAAGAGSCATGSPTRVLESFTIQFDRPGTEAPPADVALSSQPATGNRVLVGWVLFDSSLGEFTGIATTSTTGTIQYAGVRAAQVIAPAGSVVLQTQETGAKFALALAQASDGSCTLTFGKQAQDGGAISQAFQVNDKGDVTFAGAWKVQLPNSPVVESGVIGDGLCVPLPTGVTDDMITSGQFTAHIVVAPLQVGIAPITYSASEESYAIPVKCDVDGTRRVSSQVMWQSLVTATNRLLVGAPCQYLIVATPS